METEQRFNNSTPERSTLNNSKGEHILLRLSDDTIVAMYDISAVRMPHSGCHAVIILKNGAEVETKLLLREVWSELGEAREKLREKL